MYYIILNIFFSLFSCVADGKTGGLKWEEVAAIYLSW